MSLSPIAEQLPPLNHPDSWFRTGILTLDLLCGRGLPRGRMTQLFGPSQSRKSTLALALAARASRLGYLVAYLDPESGFLEHVATQMGLNMEEPEFLKPEGEYGFFGGQLVNSQRIVTPGFLYDDHYSTIEDVFQEVRRLCIVCANSNISPFIILDSGSALSTKEEEKKGERGSTMMDLPKQMRKAMRLIRKPLNYCGGVFVMIDHLKPTGAAGVGSAPGFISSVRLQVDLIRETYTPAALALMKAMDAEPQKHEHKVRPSPTGFLTQVTTVKTRYTGLCQAPVEYSYEEGKINASRDVFWAGIRTGFILEKGAGHYEVPSLPIKGKKKFHGKESWDAFYLEHVEPRREWVEAQVEEYFEDQWRKLCESGNIDPQKRLQKYLNAQAKLREGNVADEDVEVES